jgi:nascent polypeptide-associated complex subunit alpha
MIPNMNPRQMKKMMRQMGMKMEELDATRVTITLTDGRDLIIEDPNVSKVTAMGQVTYQIVGEERIVESEPEPLEISEDDIKLVMAQTGAGEGDARRALEEAEGDLAGAIMKLKQ